MELEIKIDILVSVCIKIIFLMAKETGFIEENLLPTRLGSQSKLPR